ncbi:MAG: type II toxin-antitoxin system HicB family antitoxin [Spirosoma sp.]|nr:type II toxin-antitoxin system HicB family antitoxin [Spirosoma sp.]
MKKYLVILEKAETGYGAYVPDLPGCVATASTKEEVERLIYEGIQFHIEGLELEGLPVPTASSEAELMVFAY